MAVKKFITGCFMGNRFQCKRVQKKSTDAADAGPKNPIKNSSLLSKNLEKVQSGSSTEQQESRKSKDKEQKKRGFALILQIKTWV